MLTFPIALREVGGGVTNIDASVIGVPLVFVFYPCVLMGSPNVKVR